LINENVTFVFLLLLARTNCDGSLGLMLFVSSLLVSILLCGSGYAPEGSFSWCEMGEEIGKNSYS
jgi:hypothetical protein